MKFAFKIGSLRFAGLTPTPEGNCNSSKDLITILFHALMVLLGRNYKNHVLFILKELAFLYTYSTFGSCYFRFEVKMLLCSLSEVFCPFAEEGMDVCAPADRR